MDQLCEDNVQYSPSLLLLDAKYCSFYQIISIGHPCNRVCIDDALLKIKTTQTCQTDITSSELAATLKCSLHDNASIIYSPVTYS